MPVEVEIDKAERKKEMVTEAENQIEDKKVAGLPRLLETRSLAQNRQVPVSVVAQSMSSRLGLSEILRYQPDFRFEGAFDHWSSAPLGLTASQQLVVLDTYGYSVRAAIEWASDADVGLLLVDASSSHLGLLRRSELAVWGALGPGAGDVQVKRAALACAGGLVVIDSAFELDDSEVQELPLSGIAETLTARETEILRLLATGLANKQIASKLEISAHTVKFHLSSIFAKLGAESRTEAVTAGLKLGLIPL